MSQENPPAADSEGSSENEEPAPHRFSKRASLISRVNSKAVEGEISTQQLEDDSEFLRPAGSSLAPIRKRASSKFKTIEVAALTTPLTGVSSPRRTLTKGASGKDRTSVRFDHRNDTLKAELLPQSNTNLRFAMEKLGVRDSHLASDTVREVTAKEIPPRMIIRTTRWVATCLVLVMAGLLGWTGYDISNRLIKAKATWQWVAVGVLPIMFFFFAFALKVAINTVFTVFFASVRALEKNSEYYSAISTPVMPGRQLPPVIVQIAVYKEDLNEVIRPTYDSVKAAMRRYREIGGDVKMLICDDGLQLIDEAAFTARVAFYRKRGITFVARPPANRRGLFKKASNMNYTFKLIDKVAEKTATGMPVAEALTKVWGEMNQEFIAGGDVTIPDDAIILLLDADTKIPEDALTLTMGEFIESPQLPYTQHFTMPFDEQNRNFWEGTISNFTRKIYTAGIGQGCSLGDFAPLVGHNAMLRWSAMKTVSSNDPLDNNEKKYWSENHVSEDFDLFMRFAANQQFGRYVVYTGPEFQEGVSLTYIDEIIKLRKFAYGACEMVFNKLHHWYRGPFSPLIIKFMGSRNIPWYQKVNLLSYLATYFALASGPWLNLLEAVLAVYYPSYYDTDKGYAIRGLDVIITCTVIFSGFATISEVLVRWRAESLRGGNIMAIVWDNIKYMPTISILFISCMFQLASAMACYFLNLRIVWGATTKETTDPTCFEALKNTWAMFKWQYLVMVPATGAFAFAVYWYKLTLVQAFGPLWFASFHIAGPIILNPHIMALSF